MDALHQDQFTPPGGILQGHNLDSQAKALPFMAGLRAQTHAWAKYGVVLLSLVTQTLGIWAA